MLSVFFLARSVTSFGFLAGRQGPLSSDVIAESRLEQEFSSRFSVAKSEKYPMW